jgi:hypothetical protein
MGRQTVSRRWKYWRCFFLVFVNIRTESGRKREGCLVVESPGGRKDLDLDLDLEPELELLGRLVPGCWRPSTVQSVPVLVCLRTCLGDVAIHLTE